MDNVRIDKWLWAARFFKTRSLATDAVDNGKVRLGGERIKPARAVKAGDLLAIDNGAENWEVAVIGISDKRGAAPVARLLYAETEASIARRANEAEGRKLYREPGSMIKGRPSKHDRRALSKASE
ncbi:RNA-binding S4 domain-containing protein [Massilia psychrophila]|jgi:ribosome-associated heat shock protein Hsp15|uniref:RNA-binding protein S4 n=1 Tax=Massilia psychrophila TaxID=1603353 RepID=A0A2G8T0W1_9BURK|nr:RNA-binding S4 domain-containing protein [Massilia psychrophila]PIL39654.1 RNA-binding protein S4 [Massilia psychrophila]GGE82810.1 heat-shock protein 15 [Massilia psychrophila]